MFAQHPRHANCALNASDDDDPVGSESDSPVDRPSQFTTGILLAIIGTFLFALKSIFIKLAYAEGAEPTMLLMLRLAFALPFYLAVFWQVRRSSGAKPIRPQLFLRAIVLGFLGYYLASYLDLSGLQYITAQLERLTLFVYPAIVAILAWMFLGEVLNRRIILSILLCYGGIAMMYSQERLLSDGTHVTWGVILVSGSAISYAIYILLAKPIMQSMGSRQFTSLAMIGSTVFVAIHFLAEGDVAQLTSARPVVLGYGFVLAIVCTLIPSFMINEAIMRIGATRTAVIGSAGPVLTMCLAIGVLHEPSSMGHFIGMGVAIVGVGLVTQR
ncbi:EamA-like transporter family protein [Stieleria magnilauensis]|uniref:EamA-like transporter family protein n=1 Tax=Stieleria magnilauensis TaxID=2527963 RepID=A0ABX5XPV0_9BACT|nr:EamA-like transporter family protein [Planctomycetes bacterium TBK1r]